MKKSVITSELNKMKQLLEEDVAFLQDETLTKDSTRKFPDSQWSREIELLIEKKKDQVQQLDNAFAILKNVNGENDILTDDVRERISQCIIHVIETEGDVSEDFKRIKNLIVRDMADLLNNRSVS